jgi:hypothetical protein
MKNGLQSVVRKMECDLTSPSLQVRPASPTLQLFSARNSRRLRIAPAGTRRGLTLADRKLTAARYAAEQTAWEVTGGDVLSSNF